MFQTQAIRFVQNGRVFYLAAFRAEDLVKMTEVAVWSSEGEEQGYQRAPSAARKRAIAEYAVQPDSVMPVGGLLNARAKAEEGKTAHGEVLDFRPLGPDGPIAVGMLTIPPSALPLYVVDMQHRLGGYEVAIDEGNDDLKSFPLVVTIADGLSVQEEVAQFELINTTQKKVRTDLARRLLAIIAKEGPIPEKRKWEARGAEIADMLNRGEGIWHKRILPPNLKKKDQPDYIIRETSFVSSLKPVLQTPYFIHRSDRHAADLIDAYWVALSKVFPDAFRQATRHVIQKTPGVYSLHRLFPEVLELIRDHGEFTPEAFEKVVGRFAQVGGGDEFWQSDNDQGAAQYGSAKGFDILTSRLRELLPEVKT